MKTTLRPLSYFVVGFVLVVLGASSGPLGPRRVHSGAPVTGIPVTLPLSFEANLGQVDSQVHYLARGPGYTVFLTDREAVLTLKPRMDFRGPSSPEASRQVSRPPTGAVVRIEPVGAGSQADIQGLDQLPGISNYFIGSDPAKWRTGIPTYGKVKYEQIYPGIALVYYGNQRQLEFDSTYREEPRKTRKPVLPCFLRLCGLFTGTGKHGELWGYILASVAHVLPKLPNRGSIQWVRLTAREDALT